MIYILRIIIICFLSINVAFGQNDENKNNLQFELLGKGFYYSLGYERNLATINNIKIGSNIGLSIFPGLTSLEPSTEILVPIEINFSFNKSNNEFLIGAGTTFWKYHINSVNITNANLNQQPINAELISAKEWFAHCSFEYRLHSKTKPIFYKLGYVPLFFDFTPNSKFSRSINYQTSFTIGIGWTF